ncbi:MAG: YlxM family DNA-binding protein [Fastidiosipilaceae bacterium]
MQKEKSEKIIGLEMAEAALMLDFYGELLTPRTAETMSLYYNDDFSLAEIADQFDVSRQSVHDTLKRGRRQLMEYETKLCLIKRMRERQSLFEELSSDLAKNDVEQAKKHLKDLVNLD